MIARHICLSLAKFGKHRGGISKLSSAFQLSAKNFSLSSCQLAELRYTEKHEWVLADGNIGTVGISDFAQEALGDIVFAQLPDVDSEIEAQEECGALESVKAASEVYSPVSGKITDVNKEVESDPGLINKSPLDKGWLFKLEIKNVEELQKLMTESEYSEFLKNEES